MKQLPAGIQDFASIRSNNNLYVDKTTYLLRIVQEGKFIFFSRPRRFGKSLFCSTLRYFYEGRQDLFEGLYIADKVDWDTIKRPVVHIDFSNMNLKERTLLESLAHQLAFICEELCIESKQQGGGVDFQHILEHFGRRGQKVVIIIDEYDKPLNDYLDNQAVFEEHRDVLRAFFGLIKPNDKFIEKVFITGVSRYGKTSVFSTLNNLTDISLNKPYVNMCGYTHEELESNFAEHLESTAEHFNIDVPALIAEMRLRYNGYSFDGVQTVYNPYAVLCFFSAQEFKNFWFDTGTPYFLLKLLRRYHVNYDTLENIQAEISLLGMAEIEHQSPLALLFQTGYLTLKKAIRRGFDLEYQLGFPNIEVKQAFSRYVLVEYFDRGLDLVSVDIATPIRHALQERDIDALIRIMQNQVYANIPYQIYESKEAYYHTVFHVTMNTAGFRAQSEIQTNIGRIDMVVETHDTIFIFEFKLDETANIALEQLKQRQYYQPYLAYGYPVYAIGINFSSEKRNIVDYKIQLVI